MEYFQIQISQKRSETARQTAELSSFICLRNVPAPSSHMMGTRLPFPGTGSLLVPSCCRLCLLLRVDSPAAGFCPWNSTKRPRAMKEPRAGGKSCPCRVVAGLWLWICPARRCGRAAGDRSQPWGDIWGLGAGTWQDPVVPLHSRISREEQELIPALSANPNFPACLYFAV